MCQKQLRIWTCGCTNLDDPTPCPLASSKNKICESYPFAWAFKDPVPHPLPFPCPPCLLAAQTSALQTANATFLAGSEAYPVLKDVEDKDDIHRQRQGKPRFQRGVTEDSVPPGWTSEFNRLPGNANEYSAFLNGEFDPRRRLPDTHLLDPTLGIGEVQQQQQLVQRGGRRRNMAPPLGWKGAVLMEEDEYACVRFGRPRKERLEEGRRTSYTGNKEDRGWAPPARGTLPPRTEKDVEPPSRSSSRQ